jgi:sugar lactone lactonase YvrE
MTTLGGVAPMAGTKGTQCPNLPAGVVSSDVYGDNCLAANAIFASKDYSNAIVDSMGTVFVDDDQNSIVHRVDQATGIMTVAAGNGTICAGAQTSAGDGCLAATQTVVKNQRGISVDPYGNILLAGYGDGLLHVLCRAASPLCSASQVGYMELLAGCVPTIGGSSAASSTSMIGLSNQPAVVVGSTCSATSGGLLASPRGIAADKYGNVFFADTNTSRYRVILGPLTSSYFSGNNPLYAALSVYYSSLTVGYFYTIINTQDNAACYATYTTACGGAATTKTQTCSVTTNSSTYSGAATDTYGDGCPFEYSTTTSSSGYTTGLGVDAAGNFFFPDRGLRVFFVSGAGTAGQALVAAIEANNSGVTPQPGFVYALAGGGTTSPSASPILGTTSNVSPSGSGRLTVSPQGHVYVSNGGTIYFYDIYTGYIRTLMASGTDVAAGVVCGTGQTQTSLSAYSDGCPAANSQFSAAGVSVDNQGNLYIFDSSLGSASSGNKGMLVRKVLAQGLASQTLGTSLTQTFEVHLPESVTGSVSSATASHTSNPDLTVTALSSSSCAQNADNSVDCKVTAAAVPSAPGERSAALTVTLPSATSWTNSTATVNLSGLASGSALAVDNGATTTSGATSSIAPTAASLFSDISASGVAVDGAGNVYVMDKVKGAILESIDGVVSTLSAALPSSPSQIAVDPAGNVFTVGSATQTINELQVTGAGSPASYTATTIAYTPSSGTATPQAIATDRVGNLYVADYQSGGSSIYKLTQTPNTLQTQMSVVTGLNNPVSLAVDAMGNIIVADKGANAVLKYTPGLSAGAYNYTSSTLLSNVTPVAVAVDAAGDVYVQDAGTESVIEIPVSGSTTVPVLSGITSPAGLAVDGLGNVYSANAGETTLTKVVRNALTEDFGTSTSTTYTATLTNVGNLASYGQYTGTSNTTNFAITGGTSNGCAFSSNILGSLSSGAACTMSADLIGTGTTLVDDYLNLAASSSSSSTMVSSSVGTLTLQGQLQGTNYPTSIVVSGPAEQTPTYSTAASEATFTATVSASTASTYPVGTVDVYIDSTTNYTQYTLVQSTANSSSVTVPVSGLAAGAHTIAVVYPTTGGFTGTGNVNNTTSFTIGQAGTSVSWAPGSTSQQVSAAIGTGVLNAAVTPSIPGYFIYSTTAAPSCTATNGGTINSATYLSIGTYTLYATFCPTDSTDFASASTTVSNYTVTQATTTASVGASTNVVAADGSGNYNTLSAALIALPTTGGSIYIKPGTYTGQNAISYPNVYLRGLGGDPTKVILTAEDGAFSTGAAAYLGTGDGSGNANANGDQGSSTLDVTSSYYMGESSGSTATPIGIMNSSKHTPNNFYAEYLTVQNTYDYSQDLASYYYSGGTTCSLLASQQTLQSLYNSGTLCGAQALAVWMTSDQAILNNVQLHSQQDTLLAGSQGCSSSTCTAAREYMWNGQISGNVDYVFGDAALVFDHTTFFTTYHGSASGTETIEAQNKHFQTGSSGDYLSGYICNGCTLLSQAPNMTALYYGRPYGPYSTWIMLDSQVDQVAPVGWIEFSGNTNLPTSTYGEYNTTAYTDPAVGTAPYPASINGVTPVGGNTGSGATSFSSRETVSDSLGALEASNALHTQLTAMDAAQYYPINFLSQSIASANLSSGQSATWNPVTDLAARVNAFAPTTALSGVSYGTSVTILGRPKTPGAGVTPTGSYSFYDSLGTDQVCTSASSGCTLLANGALDAAGEAYLTTGTASSNALASGLHYITMVYGGDSNFASSTSSTYSINIASNLISTATSLTITTPSGTYGGSVNGSVTVTAASGTEAPDGTVTLQSGSTMLGTCTLSTTSGLSSSCSFSLTGVPAGDQSIAASYASTGSTAGDETFAASTSNGASVNVTRAVLHVTASNASMVVGGTLPTLTYTTSGYVNSDTSSVLSGAPTLTTTATGASIGEFPITITTGSLTASNYTFSFSNGYLFVTGTAQATAVATGDLRTVTEPVFPATCQQLYADIAQVNNDIPASVDGSGVVLTNSNLVNPTATNPDGGRIQAALNACSAGYPGTGTGLAIELSADASGNNAFLTGPLTIPSNVTLLVDPGVVLFFSRNARDYDTVQGNYQCGNISTASYVCQSMIDIPKTATNVAIMGYGKMDGRSSDPLINAISPYQGFSWLGLAAAYTSSNAAQVPSFVNIERGATNVTLYKITIQNAANRHIGDGANNSTIWGVKLITPTSGRNTDGIDTGNSNITITRSWISDGDDNVALGAADTPADNISVTHNHLFAGHGQSIGSYTGDGVSNVLWDDNMAAGNGFANVGSASITGTADSNSIGIRIKAANDRGGLITGIQYSNGCFLDHAGDIQFTTLYNTNAGTMTPDYKNILLQNLVFANDYPTASAGTLQFTGADNTSVSPAVVYPLQVTLDNVTFPSALSSSTFASGLESNAQLTYGPGDVSSNFISAWAGFVATSANSDTVTNNITATSLNPPACNFTYIAPELTGPAGLPQTILQGQTATAVVILTPAVGGAAYPTGTVTLTDALTSTTYSATLPGTGDTLFIPLTGLTVGTHTFTAAYYGDTNYAPSTSGAAYSTAGPYVVTVTPAATSLSATSTTISGVPGSISYGTPITVVATVTGSNPTGTVQFIVNGSAYASLALTPSATSGTASATLTLPESATAYTIYAVYGGDTANAGSTSTTSSVTVGAAATTTALSATSTSTTLGRPITVSAAVSALAGTPTGTVAFSYTTSTSSTAVSLLTTTLSNGVASATFNLPVGTDYVSAAYTSNSNTYTSSSSAAMTFTVNLPTPIALPSTPIALPYTLTTVAGGGLTVGSSTMACTGATDKYGNGCKATAVGLNGDLRGITTDPFGNVYFTDGTSSQVRRIAPNGVISNFAGYISGTACTPSATVGCTPTLVSLSSPRGVNSDAAGNIYISGYNQNRVYKVSVTDGLLYLVAGLSAGTAGYSGDGASATAAKLSGPRAAWVDSVGDLYISDTGNYRIRMVDTTGNIQTVAGTGTNSDTGDGGPATAATISISQGVLTDANMNLYIADSSRIRVVCVTCGTGSPLDTLLTKLGITPVNGYIYTIAGGATAAYTGTYPTLATNIIMAPQKMAFDNNSNIYIADGGSGSSAPYSVVWMLDLNTGNIRPIAGNMSSNCTSETDSYGDGCPATQAIIGNNGNGFGVATDPLGNIYVTDAKNARIRKVTTGLQSSSTATSVATTHPMQLHFVPGDTLAVSNGLSYTSSEWSLTTPVCTTNSDLTADCLLTSSFTPAAPGARSTPLRVSSTLGNTSYLALTGTGSGSAATLDPASQSNFGTGLMVAGLATDNAGNVYVSDTASKSLFRYSAAALSQGASATATTLATLTAPGAVAVDQRGYAYVADASAGTVTQISPAGTVNALSFTFKSPAGLAVDAQNNLYVSDSTAAVVYQINPITGVERALALGTLVTPKGLAIDPSGNLLIADPSAPALYRYNFSTSTRSTVTTSATAPSAVVTDAAGNLLIADAAQILAVPSSSNSPSFSVASVTPSSLAIDAAGNLYTGSGSSVLELIRTQGAVKFTADAAPQTVSMLDSGNMPMTLTSMNQTDSTDYSLAATASTDCAISGSAPSTLAIGGVCALVASYNTPTSYLNLGQTDTATFAGNLVNASAVDLVLSEAITVPVPTVTLGSLTPASPAYGQSVTVSATVSSTSSVTPQGAVTFTLDGSNPITSTLSSGVGTATLTGLSGGIHSLTSAYISTNGYASATTSTALSFTISQATQSITFSPSTTSFDYVSGKTFSLSATASSGLAVSFASTTTGVCTVSGTTATIVSSGACIIAATQAGNSDYAAATPVSVSYTIGQTTQSITFAPSVSSYTYSSGGTFSLSATATSGLAVSFASMTRSVCTVSGVTATIVSAGTCTIEATQPGNIAYSAATPVLVSFTIGKATLAVSLTASASPVMLQTAVTFTANVTSTAGTPTGSVTFLDGTTSLGTVQLSSAGTAQLITSSLTVGSHSITVSYSGDTNYLPVTSSAITESVVDFTISAKSSSLTVIPGKAGQFTFTVSPVSPATTMPAAITFSVSGLPAGATYTLTPTSLASGVASSTVTLNIQTALTTAAAKPGASGTIASLSLALLLLPFVGKLRKAGKRFGRMLSILLLLGAGLAAMAGLNGCGSGGFLSQAQKSYTVTVTATSGTLSHSTSVTLTVE